MDSTLQIILVISTIIFSAYIISMINKRKLQLKYALTWILTSFVFILISIFPSLLFNLSKILHIFNPVNALFLIIIFFLMIIVFTLSVAISKSSLKVKDLTQEVGILKNYIENKDK